MTILATVSRQAHRHEAGDSDVWSVQITIVARIRNSVTRGIGDADGATVEEADAEAWADAVADFCQAAWLYTGDDIEFEVMGQTQEPAVKAADLNRAWRRRASAGVAA